MRRIFLMDTNHLSAAIIPISPVRERIYQQHRQGARFRTCVPVLCEIEVGIHGRPLSQVDMMLAAMVRRSNWTLLTADRDFEAVLGIQAENWLE
jgi:predicted nucleic acid-binding protein